MAWDKLEIEQSIKDQTLESSVMQDVPLLQVAESTEPDKDQAVPGEVADEGISRSEEPAKKKGRRRPRHRKKKSAEALAETAPENTPADELVPKPEDATVVQPVPRSMTPQFPAKPLKIVRALPDEFYPVELGDDTFAPEPGQDEPEEDKGDQ